MRSGMKEIVMVLMGLWFLCSSGCAFVSIPFGRGVEPLEEKTLTGTGKNKILVVDLSGIITEEEKKSLVGFGKEVSDTARIKEEA